MNRSLIFNSTKAIQDLFTYLRHYYFRGGLPQSVYFYTFHKCASTLFSGYVLKNLNGLYNIDYLHQIYSGKRKTGKELVFKDKGFVYGPIRLSADRQGPGWRMLVNPTTSPDFVENKIALFLVRDPRDILVSSYYSFGFTHGLSKVPEIRERQKAERRNIQEKTVDEYVLGSVRRQIELFRVVHDLSSACAHSAILKYEDMIENFDFFVQQFRKYVGVEDTVIQGMYQRSRPRRIEDTSSHRRSGQVQGFRAKLKETTIRSINIELADTLALFGYEA